MCNCKKVKKVCQKGKVNFLKGREIYRVISQVHGAISSESTNSNVLSLFSGLLNKNFSKITADGDCIHEIKRHLLLEGKL